MSNSLIRFQLRTLEDFDTVRIGLRKLMHSLETSNTQHDLGEVELVLAEVLNNIAEHGGIKSLNHPITLKWHRSDGLCINVIDAGQCVPSGTIANAQMPDLTICPKVVLDGRWWIFCAAKYTQNGAGRSIPCASIF